MSVILIPSKRLGFLLQKGTKHDDMSGLTIEKELLGCNANSCVFIKVNPVNIANILGHFRIDLERNSGQKGCGKKLLLHFTLEIFFPASTIFNSFLSCFKTEHW